MDDNNYAEASSQTDDRSTASSTDARVDEALNERKKMLRRGGRENHTSQHAKDKRDVSNKDEDTKEKWVNLVAADEGENHFMEYTGMNLPKDMLDELDALGYKAAIFGIKQVNNNIREGWNPLRKTEMPRWDVHCIPVGETYEESMSEYCTFGDMVVMIIKKSRFNENRKRYDKSIKDDAAHSRQAENNGTMIDTNQPHRIVPLEGRVRA